MANKKFYILGKKIEDMLYTSFKEATEDADEDDYLFEIEVKVIKTFKKQSWIEIKSKK